MHNQALHSPRKVVYDELMCEGKLWVMPMLALVQLAASASAPGAASPPGGPSRVPALLGRPPLLRRPSGAMAARLPGRCCTSQQATPSACVNQAAAAAPLSAPTCHERHLVSQKNI